MKPKSRQFILAFVLCLAMVTVSLVIWPGARFSFVIPAYMAICAIVLGVYGCCRWQSAVGGYLLLAMTTLSTCGAIINVNYFTTVFSVGLDQPVLFNWDAATDWNRALYNIGLSNDPGLFNSRHLASIASGLIWIFGIDITVPIMFNVLCYGMTLTAFGSVAYVLTDNRRVALAALVVGSTICYLYNQSTWFIKDVPITLCIATCAYVFVRWRQCRGVKAWECAMLGAAVILLLFLRANFMYMVALGAALMAVRRNPWRVDARFVVVIAAAVAMRLVYTEFFVSVSAEALLTVDGGTTLNDSLPPTKAWDNMNGGNYALLPLWRQLVVLPASVVVQFLVPFPWNFGRDMIFGPTFAVAHFGFCWYYAGALILYWLFAVARKCLPTMRLIVLWGVIMTVLTAYMTAGRVSRYCLPYLPLLLPAAAYVAVNCWRRRSLWVWLGVFTALLVPTLVVCYHLQMSAS